MISVSLLVTSAKVAHMSFTGRTNIIVRVPEPQQPTVETEEPVQPL
jgi:hypothetical protein